MAARNRAPKRTVRRLKVGDRVVFKMAGRQIRGVIVEDRGKIGKGGRRLFAIRAKIDRSEESTFELPAEELRVAPTAA